MANITHLTASNYIPEIWANRAMDFLRNEIVLARLVTKDSDVAAFNVGDVLHIQFPGKFTAADKSPDTPVVPSVPADESEVLVTLDRHKHVTFLVEDRAAALANQNLIDIYSRAAAAALAEAIESDLFALYASLTETVGTSGADITEAAILDARERLNRHNIPRRPRYLVISPKDEKALLQIPRFTEADKIGTERALQALAEGALGRIHGFDVFVSPMVPVVSGTPDSTKNLAFHPEAFILAMRSLPMPPPNTGARGAVIRDEMSGLVLRAVVAYNPSHLGVQVTLDVLYGVAVLRNKAGVVVLS